VENLIYDAVTEHREELENNQECAGQKKSLRVLSGDKENIDPLTSTVEAVKGCVNLSISCWIRPYPYLLILRNSIATGMVFMMVQVNFEDSEW